MQDFVPDSQNQRNTQKFQLLLEKLSVLSYIYHNASSYLTHRKVFERTGLQSAFGIIKSGASA